MYLRLVVARVFHDQVGQVLQALQGDVCSAKRQRDVARQHPSQRSTECQRTEALRPAQVDFARVVNAVQSGRDTAVGLEQLIADDELPGAGQIGQLKIVARQGVAQVAHRQVTPFHDAVQDLVDELAAGDPFGRILGEEFHAIQSALDQRLEP